MSSAEKDDLAEAWERGAYAGREFQKNLAAWHRGLSIGRVPTMPPNPYRDVPPEVD